MLGNEREVFKSAMADFKLTTSSQATLFLVVTGVGELQLLSDGFTPVEVVKALSATLNTAIEQVLAGLAPEEISADQAPPRH